MPGASIGHGVTALTTVFHYGLGSPRRLREVLRSPLHTALSAGGLVDLWHRAAAALLPWYQEIGREALSSATLHADETGWRVNGDTHWLWCFANHASCYYMIDERRGETAPPRGLESRFEELANGGVAEEWEAMLAGVGDEADAAGNLATLHGLADGGLTVHGSRIRDEGRTCHRSWLCTVGVLGPGTPGSTDRSEQRSVARHLVPPAAEGMRGESGSRVTSTG